jgi:excinuclease ABC subunit C
MLACSLPFDAAHAKEALGALPAAGGVFALFGADAQAEPYLAKTPNIRRRLRRFLDARPTQSKRLELAGRVARIEYTLTGSAFETNLVLYEASRAAFGERARKRLHLKPPAFLRMAAKNPYPRLYVTNKVTKSAADDLFGPFASRAAAERYLDEMLNLFLLRRCTFDLDPDPKFPGCVYSEMKMCLAPCFQGCTDERYAEEAAAVRAFLETRGASLTEKLAAERDAASAELDFEKAAAVHARMQKVEGIAAQQGEAVRPLSRLRALIAQPAAEEGQVAVFLLDQGALAGPVLYSTLGMRLHNERSGSSSLYSQPVAVEAVPLDDAAAVRTTAVTATRDTLDRRLDEAYGALVESLPRRVDADTLADHLCLFTRWCYRPQAQRVGEAVFFEAGELPYKAAQRAISRVARNAAASL